MVGPWTTFLIMGVRYMMEFIPLHNIHQTDALFLPDRWLFGLAHNTNSLWYCLRSLFSVCMSMLSFLSTIFSTSFFNQKKKSPLPPVSSSFHYSLSSTYIHTEEQVTCNSAVNWFVYLSISLSFMMLPILVTSTPQMRDGNTTAKSGVKELLLPILVKDSGDGHCFFNSVSHLPSDVTTQSPYLKWLTCLLSAPLFAI